MKRLLAGAVLALTWPVLADGATIPPILLVYGVRAAGDGVTVRVPPLGSGRCTPTRAALTMAIDKGAGGTTLLVAARPVECRVSGAAGEVHWTFQELGLKPGDPFRFANPLITETGVSAVAAGGPQRIGICQKLEVVAVTALGKGVVRVLGPEGPLDIEAPPLVSYGEVTGAQAGANGGGTVVRVSLAPQAAQRLSAWTSSHLGSRMAVLLDGQVIRLGQVAGPIGADGLQLTGFESAQATAIAAGLNGCGG